MCVSGIFLSAGCDRVARHYYLSQYDGEIKKATRTIERAQNEAQRATAYADRGDAYAEKAAYLRVFKVVPSAEYDRLFELAIQDHDQAIALEPDNAEMYYHRGSTYFSRAVDPNNDPKSKAFFAPAKADFSKAIEQNPRHYMAFDVRGMINEQAGEWEQAIADYTQETALNPQGRFRLADAYCNRGSFYLREKKYDLAVSDFEKSIEIGSSADACQCEPYNPLVWLYLDEQHDYEKAWAVVRRAQNSKKWIAPEYLEQLRKGTTPDRSGAGTQTIETRPLQNHPVSASSISR